MTVAVRQRDAFPIAARPRHKFVGYAADTLLAERRGQHRRGDRLKLSNGIRRQLEPLRQQAQRPERQQRGNGGEPLEKRASFHMLSTRPKS